MKVSVSLPGEDVQFLDEYAREQGLESRSAAVHRAVRLLRVAELGAAYESAWDSGRRTAKPMRGSRPTGDGLVEGAPS